MLLSRRAVRTTGVLLALFALGGRAGVAAAPAVVAPPHTTILRAPARTMSVFRARTLGTFGPQAGKIQHVVFVMQENRSFDNLWQGYPKADTKPYGYDHYGRKIKLQPIGLEAPYDIDHYAQTWFTDYDGGKMDGFDQNGVYGQHGAFPQYGYVPHNESAPYFKLAHSYALGDRMFTSHVDASFVSHQYFIAGQAMGSVDLPYGNWGCPGMPQVATITEHYPQLNFGSPRTACYNYTTLAQELDTAGLPWRFYAADQYDIWSAYQAISYVCVPTGSNCTGPEFNTNVIAPNTQFLTDVASGTLGAVTWITPTCADSDHGGCEGNGGPAWVTSIVDAVGQSKFWDTTAIFVMWDEWGGWYDHVKPPLVDYDGLGMRVGLLMISPYTRENYVSHTQYEHGSVLKFIEETFGLPKMTASDMRANSPTDAFDFNQKPRKFKRFDDVLTPAQLYYHLPDFRAADAE